MYETYLSFGISRNANCMDWSEPKYLTWDYYAHYSNYYTHYLEVLIFFLIYKQDSNVLWFHL
jgi:hypothetical protein